MGAPLPQHNDFVVSYEGVSASSVLPAWERKLSQFITTMEVQPRQLDDPFIASWRHHDLGEMAVNVIHSPSQRVVHHQSGSRAQKQQFELLYMVRNSINLTQMGRSTTVKRGEFVLLDNQQPFSFD